MKRLILLLSLFASASTMAMDEYSSASDNVKAFIQQVVKQLDAPGGVSTERKVFGAIDFIFEEGTDWSAYWLGYNDLSSSKISNPEVTYIEQFVNTSKHGMYFVSFIYDKKANQILVNRKQIRYGSKSALLGIYQERKDDSETYRVVHENDNYALLQANGYVRFSGFNISGDNAAVVYFNQSVLDL